MQTNIFKNIRSNSKRLETLILGLGVTGVSAANYFSKKGHNVTAIDSRANPPGLNGKKELSKKVGIYLETLDISWLRDKDLVIVSPGIEKNAPILTEAKNNEIPIVSDIEIFIKKVSKPILAITGTNGKSTVVSLLEHLFTENGIKVAAGGNLGIPALDLINKDIEIYILELSSFQLDITDNPYSKAAAILNIYPDHLDRHITLQNYKNIKKKVFNFSELAVYNYDDISVREMVEKDRNSLPFSQASYIKDGFSIKIIDGIRWYSGFGRKILPVDSLNIKGPHNESNVLAAIALASSLDREINFKSLRSFKGLPHRCELVGEKQSISFINDSKSTNVSSTIAAINSYKKPIVLIAGGRSKGANFNELSKASNGKLIGAVVLGESAKDIEYSLSSICPVKHASSMKDAVERAWELSSNGASIILSPACSSFDMYSNYVERGDNYIRYVEEFLQ
ncbi:MAG: UDP-N-acetylmuramoyl-L-alanine--D-glutamate ligase [Gammaproteobacteria bacterium TMED78]|nr:MAG: UDP-N-acetylmuramoyl-L-alanine--D-glutamate ligase [Gammaproteobacteria bacterium TMED78]|tara:strand:- start:76840 stop:78195 length:1356 start_codon:yes stop_codon:yes gene_type:complete